MRGCRIMTPRSASIVAITMFGLTHVFVYYKIGLAQRAGDKAVSQQ